jgi:di/tricarboxylate transporter
MLSLPIIIILFTILFLLAALYFEFFKPAVVFFIAILVFVIAGILSPKEALSGFANEQLAVIVLLLIISDIFRKSSVIDVLFNRLFAKSSSTKSFSFHMMGMVASLSAFFNNTPLVAMMMPYVNRWAGKHGVASSKLLIPLSYAAILGGCVTLIGTSTNLIVNGFAVEAGYPSLSIFDFTAVGLPMLIIGIVFLLFFGNRLLPDNKHKLEAMVEDDRKYFIEAMIKSDSKLIGKTVEKAGLRNLKGLYLVEIVRNDQSLTPVSPDERLQEDDALVFAGETNAVEEISKKKLGLTLPKKVERMLDKRSSVNEIVISYNSPLIGEKVMDTDFRARFDAAIVAIHRNGERLKGKIGEQELLAGDVLLVFSGNDFISRSKNSRSFYILTHTEEAEEVNVKKVGLVFTSLIAAILLSAFTSVPLIAGLSVVLLMAIIMDIVPLDQIRRGLDFDLILLIAFGLAFGKAMINSGASIYLADLILQWHSLLSPPVLLMFIFLSTNLLAAYITNKAAVAILFPISLAVALSAGYDPIPFILIVSFGAAANFITPLGYQTNLMVYGPGGYTFKDYLRVGLPLTILYMLGAALILTYVYDL